MTVTRRTFLTALALVGTPSGTAYAKPRHKAVNVTPPILSLTALATGVRLGWTPAVKAGTTVASYRPRKAGVFLGTLGPTVLEFDDLTTTSGTEYDVVARFADGTSTTSPVVQYLALPANTFHKGVSPGGSRFTLEQMREVVAAGGTHVRLDVIWADVEPTVDGGFDWSATDVTMANAVTASIKVLPILTYTPAWARVAPGSTHYYPPQAQYYSRYAEFCKAFAQRYTAAGPVVGFELWNEPNIPNFWASGPNATDYTKLCIAASDAIKSIHGEARPVIFGALAPAIPDAPNISAPHFVEAMYAAGAKGKFDQISVHSYSWPSLPWDNAGSRWSIWHDLVLIRDKMLTEGDEAKQILLTEGGAPSAGAADLSEANQATAISQSFELTALRPYISGLYVYSWVDDPAAAPETERWFGLTTSSGATKPAHAAFVTAPVPNGAGTRGTYADAVLNYAPALYLRLGEASGSSFADTSQYGRTGSLVGSGTVSHAVTGLIGDGNRAVRLGVGRAITVDDATPLRLSTTSSDRWTLSWLMKVDAAGTSFSNLFSKGDGQSPQGTGWMIYRHASSSALSFKLGGAEHGTETDAVITGRWQHWTLVFDGGHVRWYRDGGQNSVNTIGVARTNTDTAPFCVNSLDGSEHSFDEVSVIAGTALNALQVATLHAKIRNR